MRPGLLARFDQLSDVTQIFVLIALPVPIYIIFAIAGDFRRGALAWTFIGTLFIVLNAHPAEATLSELWKPAVLLVLLHLPVVVWNPLRHFTLYGGLITPLAYIDGCIDYGLLWSWRKVWKVDSSS